MVLRKKNENTGRPTWGTSVKHSGTAFETGAAFNLYNYNSRSEVTAGARFWEKTGGLGSEKTRK